MFHQVLAEISKPGAAFWLYYAYLTPKQIAVKVLMDTLEDKIAVIQSTFAHKKDAEDVGRRLIAEKLCACSQISAPILSIFTWRGKREECREYRLTVKSRMSLSHAVCRRLVELHPYDTPEIIQLQVAASADYARWVVDSCVSP